MIMTFESLESSDPICALDKLIYDDNMRKSELLRITYFKLLRPLQPIRAQIFA